MARPGNGGLSRRIRHPSRLVRESLVDQYGVPPERVQIIGAGANVFPRSIERRDDGKTIVFIGKEFVRKGGPVLLRAFERLRRERDARLILAGPTEPIDLPEGAMNLGLVPFEALPDLLARATVFTLPTARAPFGIAFLDAMACGVPCVGTAIESIPDIIEHGRTGLLVPPGDDVALAEALRLMLDDPARARAMGERGRQRVAERFLWSHVVARLEPLLGGVAPSAAVG